MATDTFDREPHATARLAASASSESTAPLSAPRKRGRPLLVPREQVSEQIRQTAAQGGLFRVHFDQPALYARARRLWGSWENAVRAAGVDYDSAMSNARRRSIEGRRRPR